jgi:hypothetical protein
MAMILVVAFADGSRLLVPEEMLVAQPDGTYYLRLNQTAPVNQVVTASVADELLVVPVLAEELTVEKHQVAIGKEVTEKIETIRDTLRRTDVQIEEMLGVRAFDEYAGDFRRYYTQRLAVSGLAYERYIPAFRYGYSLASNEPFRSQSCATRLRLAHQSHHLVCHALWGQPQHRSVSALAGLPSKCQFGWTARPIASLG